MMWIKLTDTDGEPFYINMAGKGSMLRGIEDKAGLTLIWSDDDVTYDTVKETPEEIMALMGYITLRKPRDQVSPSMMEHELSEHVRVGAKST
jgi:hypothetical protein